MSVCVPMEGSYEEGRPQVKSLVTKAAEDKWVLFLHLQVTVKYS